VNTRLKKLIAIGVTVLLVGLLAGFPARVAYQWFAPTELRLAGISGTLWKGAASEGMAAGLYLRNLHWTFKPFALLTGKLAFATQLDPAGGFLQSDIYAGPGNSLELRNLDAAIPISALQVIVQVPELDGSISVQFSSLEIRDGLPVVANGFAEIGNLFVRGLASAPVGDFRAEFSTTDDGILASIEDKAGMFDLAGTLRIAPDGVYSLVGLIAPTSTTPPEVIEQLRFLGSPNERGQREFRFEGQL
jgi:general secretion pathway protein N